jgi:integrase
VLGLEIGELSGIVRVRKPIRLPVVMTHAEVRPVLDALDGQYRLIASLMYGCGLRLSEVLALRVHERDLAAGWGSVVLPDALART